MNEEIKSSVIADIEKRLDALRDLFFCIAHKVALQRAFDDLLLAWMTNVEKRLALIETTQKE